MFSLLRRFLYLPLKCKFQISSTIASLLITDLKIQTKCHKDGRQGLLFSIFIKTNSQELILYDYECYSQLLRKHFVLISVKTIRSLWSFFTTEILMNRSRYRVSRARSRDQIFDSSNPVNKFNWDLHKPFLRCGARTCMQ